MVNNCSDITVVNCSDIKVVNCSDIMVVIYIGIVIGKYNDTMEINYDVDLWLSTIMLLAGVNQNI